MKLFRQQITDKIIDLLKVQYLYEFPIEIQGTQKSCVLVIKNNADKPKGNLPSVSDIFKEHPEYKYRIYPENYAREQLAQGNIFFIHACLSQHLEYHPPEVKALDLFPDIDIKQLLDKAEVFFQKEYTKAIDFKDGARFYLEKENYPQAAFMLHQAFELSYRTVELFTMGKEKVCHGITNHQEYIAPFVPELGQVFSSENELDTKLVKLLDIAYRDVRYDQDYCISPQHITVLQAKLEKVLAIVEREFYSRFYSCKKEVDELQEVEEQDLPQTLEVTERLKRLIKTRYRINKKSGQLWQKADISGSSAEDLPHTVNNMIKTCFDALNEEMQFLETLIEIYGEMNEMLKDQ